MWIQCGLQCYRLNHSTQQCHPRTLESSSTALQGTQTSNRFSLYRAVRDNMAFVRPCIFQANVMTRRWGELQLTFSNSVLRGGGLSELELNAAWITAHLDTLTAVQPSQAILRISWSPKVHRRIQTVKSLVPMLRQISPSPPALIWHNMLRKSWMKLLSCIGTFWTPQCLHVAFRYGSTSE